MALTTGTRLGPYEVQAPLGAGGMGEVYKATDTRLNRVVAIKILPAEWANDPAMKERFGREAQTIASLNHPHICVLHDIGNDRGIDFLVMEFLTGETLADRLTRGAVPLEEAMTIAVAIADALDKAHRQGVIHRDLKPANVMLTDSGPKLLDFGLAKTGAALPSATNVTLPGMILGTMQYMAPEQFDGVEADRRTDIFAFGVVLHEMVTGKKTFEGKSQVMLISAIATAEPQPVSRVQPAAPPALDHVVKTCLAKDPADRWQDVRDLLAELHWIAEGGEDAGFPVSAATGRPARQWWRPAALVASVAAVAALTVPAYGFFKGPPAPEELRFRIPRNLTAEPGETQPGTGTSFNTFSSTDSAISPNGRTIAFVARPAVADTWFLYLRPVGAVTPEKIAGTEDASQPFWSPDSQWVVFVNRSTGKLRRVPASGGAVQNVGDAPGFMGGSLNADGTIIFGSANGLFQVPAEGGKPVALTTIGPAESGHLWPRFLPDGRRYLYLAASADASGRAVFVGSLDSKDKTKVLSADSNAIYVEPTPAAGYLIFHNEATVYAQPFNIKTLAVSGKPTRLANEVVYDPGNAKSSFDASDAGVLIYYVNTLGTGGGGQDSWPWRIMWSDRSASDGGDVGPVAVYRGVELSPDGKRVATHKHEGAGGDIWVLEPPPSAPKRITFDATQDNSSPVWSPNGSQIVFASLRKGKWGLYVTRSDGSGAEELLLESELRKAPMSWSQDGKRLVYWVQDPKTAGDLWVLPMDGEKRNPEPFIATRFNETHAQISWDGKWIAYTSDLTGRKEVYVQPFPSGLGRYQVSPDALWGGDWPRWKRDGKELFYHSIDFTPGIGGVYAVGDVFLGPIFSAPVSVTGTAFVPGTPSELVRLLGVRIAHPSDYHTFDVSQDGQRFLTTQRVLTSDAAASGQFLPEMPTPGLTVAINWVQGIKK